ncbi:hypothetical protein KXQ82_05155 [Mucilaginibacter sp. HMF5004]|uniref:hypothetical protein n=1 Tax=Mucilaginibacter rivuli TaxID=2857527 RepID=UPI001C5F28BC|nr:hypothetical protein [Mucilaginibacter rivuli]MBW4889089.1 hypothetical protein [Mucilaginibacter rivuli]
MKKILLFAVLVFAVIFQSAAQLKIDTRDTVTAHRQKRKFIPPEKIIIPASIDTSKRYANFVKYIKIDYNASINSGFYPIGLSGVTIKFAENGLNLKSKELSQLNPFGPKSFPLSYSVIYHDRIITLFEPGMFMCLQVANLKRDTVFEKMLNTQRFNYHWLVNGKLLAVYKNDYYEFNNNKWIKYNKHFPLLGRPKLFEDDKYICYADCRGEFGGNVYFCNKQTDKTYFTKATCAVTVYKDNGKYKVLSTLGHIVGSANLVEIADPDKLPLKQYPLPQVNSTDEVKKVFSYSGVQLFSTFKLKEQQYFITNWQNFTFLATFANNVLTIADPLLDKNVYMHNVITNTFGDTVLTTYSYYGESGEFEHGIIVINSGCFTRIKWN